MKKSLSKRIEVIRALSLGKMSKQQAAEMLECSLRTIDNYLRRYQEGGETALQDKRHSNYYRLSAQDRERIITLKKADRWRSARNIVDKLKLPVHEITVWRICKQANLIKENVERVKALQRFECQYPNDMWQTDIMGRIDFPKIKVHNIKRVLGSAWLTINGTPIP
jgi:transposase